jgi:hypothetical protein
MCDAAVGLWPLWGAVAVTAQVMFGMVMFAIGFGVARP